MPDTRLTLAIDVAARYAALTQVEAVAAAGSLSSGVADAGSDIDMYVYVLDDIPVAVRRQIATTQAERAEVDNRFWEPGDEWIDAVSGIHVDVMFRWTSGIEEQLDRVLRRHEAAVGYTTCFWHNVLSSRILFDPTGWFTRLQKTARQPYPEPLRQAIIAKNHPILRHTLSSYRYQIERAIDRGDVVSINHRMAAVLASYFDILFAVNGVAHPGEKRLVNFALERCAKLPHDMEQQIRNLVQAVGRRDQWLLKELDVLLDGLDELLRAEGLLPLSA